jgi:hypothetical protein
MRQIILCITACTLLTQVKGQINLPLPEFKNTINQVDTVNKTLKNLEKASAEVDIKIKGLGYGGSETYLKISGKESSVTLEGGQATFVVKLPDADTDPTTYVELYKFDSDKDRRRVKIGSRKMLGKTRNVDIPNVDLTFSKITSGCYLITVTQPLKKGSYGFVVDPASITSGVTLGSKQSATVFAFDFN